MNKADADRIVIKTAIIYGFLFRGLCCVVILIVAGGL
jgi:hypothetical protein